MDVVFVNYYDFRSQSGMHIFHLANALVKQGVRVAVCSHGDGETVSRYGKAKFTSYDNRTNPRKLADILRFTRGETLVHAWTPRENVRVYTESLAEAMNAPVVVHMEDNEEAITAGYIANGAAEKGEGYDPFASAATPAISHPARYREFLRSAGGYTCIVEALLDFKPESVPGHVFWPSCEPEVFTLPPESSPEEKKRWGLDPQAIVLFYPGNIHPLNSEEVFALFKAVGLLRKEGLPLQIITYGNYELESPDGSIVNLNEAITPAAIPQVMRAVDLLVQPGEENAFNHYRFPCKIPLFLASARPVILPPANIGAHLTHGENCLILPGPSPQEIAACIRTLVKNPEKAKAIGARGREFAKKYFDWNESAKGVKEFYATVMR
ncbi:hypothetical protein FACS1894206_00870 [Deltaproteobacteria bacterium]|nr:hypothetical protein FACS1894206_00870 [Deltaproteobacteria bacterium]